jgi:hypothetical protein
MGQRRGLGMSPWLDPLVFNSVGESHSSTQTPCQDAVFVQTAKDHQWVVAVVCDGAGSAKHSLEGAKITCAEFGQALLGILNDLESRVPGAWINDAVIRSALSVRDALRQKAGADDLRDYHTTLVAVLLGPTGGFSVHIGDGAVFGARVTIKGDKALWDDNFIISVPQNGEYSNETFFITEGDWVKHLRITPMPSLDWIMIGSDGGCSIALNPANEIRGEFFLPLVSRYISDQETNILSLTMRDPKWRPLTDDDKTLVFVASQGIARNLLPCLSEKKEVHPNLVIVSKERSSKRLRYLDWFRSRGRKIFITLLIGCVVLSILLTAGMYLWSDY